jgi:hypothetical protein
VRAFKLIEAAQARWRAVNASPDLVALVRTGARFEKGNKPSSASSGSPSRLVTWFSGAAICILIGACAGPVLAEDTGQVGSLIRGGESQTLTAGARPSLAPPARELTLRDAFHSTEDSWLLPTEPVHRPPSPGPGGW